MKDKINRKDIVLPTKEELLGIIRQTLPEVSTLRMLVEKMDDGHKFSNNFVSDSIIRSSDLVRAISSLTETNIDCIHILMRSQLEVCVDLLWFYSIYLNNKVQSDNLAKRFYQFNINHYLKVSNGNSSFLNNDPYLKTIESKIKQLDAEVNTRQNRYIELVDPNANSKLKDLQSKYWEALPGLITKREEIIFRTKAEKASSIVLKTSNLKDAPFYKNWMVLNAFTHWSAARMNYLDSDVAEVLFLRNFNISIGLLYDMMGIGYLIKGVYPPVKMKLLAKQFNYFSL